MVSDVNLHPYTMDKLAESETHYRAAAKAVEERGVVEYGKARRIMLATSCSPHQARHVIC